jgi:hypothetical protein
MLSQGHQFHLRSLFDLGWCRLNAFVAQWIRGMASWVLVIVAFDRFRQSRSIRRIQTNKNHVVLYTMLITGFILAILNLHYLLFTGSKVSLGDTTIFVACIFHKHSDNVFQKFFASTSVWQELVILIIVVSLISEEHLCL